VRIGRSRAAIVLAAVATQAALTVAATALVGGAAHAAAAREQPVQPDSAVRVELDSMSPRLVTADGAGVLTVTGRVFNGGDRTLSGLDVRVQRGQPVRTEGELREALAGSVATDSARPRFTEIAADLPPGGALAFRVEIALRGGKLDSLGINEPGVYPLLVNLNGTPEFGGRSRLAAVRLLLPVLGLPAAGNSGPVPSIPAAPSIPTAPPAAKTPLTIIWPLVDRPRRLPNEPNQPALLTDDDLAVSLAPGGRLRGLLDTAAQLAPAGSPLAPALCFAIDPELIDTVTAMAQSAYLLADGRPGAGGGQAAAEWLQLLNQLVRGAGQDQADDRCVLALPFADVDSVALSRAGLTDLQGRARTEGEQILINSLGVRPIGELAWPAGELLDERTLTDLASLGNTAVLLDPAGLADPGAAAGHPAVGLTTGSPVTAGLRAVLVDPLVGGALAGSVATAAGTGPTEPVGPGSVVISSTPAGTDRALSSHDGSAALAWRIMAGGSATSGVLLAPPRRWAASGVEAAELLRTAAQLVTSGFAAPRDLGRLVGGQPPTAATAIRYPARAGEEDAWRSVAVAVTTVRNQLRDMDDATDRDPRHNVDPASLLDPLRYNLLRAMSSAWRGEGDSAASRFAADAGNRLAALRESVRVEPPAGPYLLAASNAPLLLTLDNPLLVQIEVQITLSEVSGLRTGPVDVVQVPATSRRQVRIPTEVVRAGQFSVEAQLSTPGGTPLGPRGTASRIQLRSTAYGTVTLAITGGGAVLLVLLAAVRITRRVRAARKAPP
jgi:Family of unknown function (DUF6049)